MCVCVRVRASVCDCATPTRGETGWNCRQGHHLVQVGDSQQEADGVQDVGLATAVQSSDGIELGVKPTDDCALCIGLEPVQNQLLDEHRSSLSCPRNKHSHRTKTTTAALSLFLSLFLSHTAPLGPRSVLLVVLGATR